MNLQLEKINEMAEKYPREFVEEEDRKYHDRIKHAADLICDRRHISPIVLLSGPSGSGKTTTAKKLEEELESRGINAYSVSMDDYFKSLNPATAPRTPDGEIDYESPEHLDMDLLNEHFTMLSEGREIHIPYFMFARQKRSASRFTPMQLKDNEIAIFEGIHAFNDAITDRHPEAFKLYICAMSDIEYNGKVVFENHWERIVRRTVRDSKFRGADAAETLSMWRNILRGEELYIYPYTDRADVQINSSLGYDLPVLKKYGIPEFESLGDKITEIEEAPQVLEGLRLFADMDDSFVQKNALIREFVGGGKYDY